MPAYRCVVQDCSNKSIRELESLCIRQRAILNLPNGNRSFALTASTPTSTGFSRSTQFISESFELNNSIAKQK